MTDIVDSTPTVEQLGDAAASAWWREHDRTVRALLCECQGQEIDRSDGFLAVFLHAAEAATFAIRLHAALAQLSTPARARVAIHAGAVVLRANPSNEVLRGAKPIEVDGLAKPFVARVLAIAPPGRTLLTATVKEELVDAHPGISSLGHWKLKGLSGVAELFDLPCGTVGSQSPEDSDKGWRVVEDRGLWMPRRSIRHSLPAERDRFFGRQAVLSEIWHRFDAGSRLVCLLGTGGIGKTRTCQRYGWEHLGEYTGGIWFCDLSAVSDFDGLVRAVAQGLDTPLSAQEPARQIAEAIAGRGSCLIVLDNFEHLLVHADKSVGLWLDSAPQARFLVATRSPLGLPGETLVQVPPLELTEAAGLFVDRASLLSGHHAKGDELADIDNIVKLLDGLPLAVELLAARTRVLPAARLLQRMAGRFALLSDGTRRGRQATMRAAIDWSWDLLGDDDRLALCQLAIFSGGFSLEAAENVLALERTGPLDAVQSLVDKSLLRRIRENRFEMLGIIQEYATGQWTHVSTSSSVADLQAQARLRFCRYFASQSTEAVLAERCVNLENFIFACREAISLGQAGLAERLLRHTWAALDLRGPFQLGRELALEVAAICADGSESRARAELIAGNSCHRCGFTEAARLHFEAALTAARTGAFVAIEGHALKALAELNLYAGRIEDASTQLGLARQIALATGDRQLECNVLNAMGTLGDSTGQLLQARGWYEAALSIAETIGDRLIQAGTLGNLAQLYANAADLVLARTYYARAIGMAEEIGHRQWQGNSLCNLGLLEQSAGNLDLALGHLNAALAISKELGHVRLEAVVTCNIGLVHAAARQWQQAAQHHRAAISRATASGDRRSQGQFQTYLADAQAMLGELEQGMESAKEAIRLLGAVDDKLSLGICLCSQSQLHKLLGHSEEAWHSLAQAEAIANALAITAGSELGTAIARARSALKGG